MRLGAMCLFFLCLQLFGQRPTLTIGVCADGDPNDFQSEFLPVLHTEVTTLLERDYDVRFPDEFLLRGNWDQAKIQSNLQTLLAEPAVDLIVCFGVFSSLQATQNGPYKKPVFAPFGIDADLPTYPRTGDSSGVHNLNYLVAANGLNRDLPYIQKLAEVHRVHMIGDSLFINLIPGLNDYLDANFKKYGLEVTVVAAADRAAPILDQIDDATQFVYITPLLRLSNAERDVLFHG